MNKRMQVESRAFTTRFNGRSNKLFNDVYIKTDGKDMKAIALWDTGATHTCISDRVASELNLTPIGQSKIHTAGGESIVDTYCIDLKLPNDVLIKDTMVTGSDIAKQGLDVLIGMDIIGIGDFTVSSFNGITQFSFRIPSLCDADFTENKIDGFKRMPIVKGKKIQPNDKCPCGSGLKYKQCCGKNK